MLASPLPARQRRLARPALARVACLAVALAVLAPPLEAAAAPIGIRARTRVELVHRRSPSGIELLGRLLDDRGEPVADERVSLELPGLEPEARTTDAEGRFTVALDRRTVTQLERAFGRELPWTLRFAGNRRLGETASSGRLDISRAPSRLSLSTPQAEGGRVALGRDPVELVVALDTPDLAGDRPISGAELRIKVGLGSELVGATGTSGRATFVLRPDLLEAGGRYRVEARFGGDLVYAPSRAELDLDVLLPTRLTLRVVREGDEARGRYRFSGRLADEDGPLAGRVIAITGRRAGDTAASAPGDGFDLLATTGADGVFIAALPARELHDKRLSRLLIEATFRPTEDVHAPAKSQPVLLDVPPPPGIPARYYLLSLGLVVLVVALAQAARSGALTRAVARLLERLRALAARWRAQPATPTPEGEPPFVMPQPVTPGRPRESDRVSGTVVDAHERTPLPALVTARSGDQLLTARAGADGRFALGPLAPGAWLVEVAADGYLARELALEIPHPGAYDGAQWALVAVHRKLRDIFGEAVGALGQPLAWGRDTPRETFGRAVVKAPDPSLVEPPLAELTALVERAHFARELAPASAVDRARSLQRQVEPNRPPEGTP